MNRYLLGSFIILTIIYSSCSNKTETSNIDYPQNKKALENTIKLLVDVNVKMNNLEVETVKNSATNNSIVLDRFKRFDSLLLQLDSGIKESEKVSDKYLDYLHPEMKHMFRDVYMLSNKIWLTSQIEQLNKFVIDVKNRKEIYDSTYTNGIKQTENNLVSIAGDSLTSKQIDDTLMGSKYKYLIGLDLIDRSKKIDSMNITWWNFVKLIKTF